MTIRIQLSQVIANNRDFLEATFGISEVEYFAIMAKMGPSLAFQKKYKKKSGSSSFIDWDRSNPTRGWCAQMTRFLKDYKYIPAGYVAYTDKNRDHYYFIKDAAEVIDMTIYQAGYSDPSAEINYELNVARFFPVKTRSSADAMRLNICFEPYYKKKRA